VNCRRCDFVTDPDSPAREQLAAHAADSGHPLCICCHRSLADTDPALVCESDITEARSLLSGIVAMFCEAPSHLGHLHPIAYGSSHGGGDGRPLLGGDALVLLSGGSEGLSEDPATSRQGDPMPVSFLLEWWAKTWATEQGDFIKFGHTPSRVVARASGYLERRARWAANSHLGFEKFLADLKRTHSELERVTGRDLPTEKANADCFDCGGDLVRVVDPATGLSTENVSCRRCHASYDPQRYALALRAAWESKAEWVSLREAARAARVSVDHVKKWVQRGHVAAACPVEGGVQQVWWPDVLARVSKKEAS
jgi:hypothetical protein